jgi:hypothetical protein
VLQTEVGGGEGIGGGFGVPEHNSAGQLA